MASHIHGSRSNTNMSPGVSPMMQVLNEEALSRAQRMLIKKFQDVSSLDDISSLRAELQGKLSSADAKLKGAVQGEPLITVRCMSASCVCLSTVCLSLCVFMSTE